jgi:hypothetical protein
MAREVLDSLDYGLEGPLQLQDLLPTVVLACRCLSWQHQVVMGVSSHDRPIFCLVVSHASDDGHHVHDWALGPKLEVVGANQAHTFLGPQ